MTAQTANTLDLREELLHIVSQLPEEDLARVASALRKAQRRAERRGQRIDPRQTGVFSMAVEGRFRERSDDMTNLF